MSTENFTPAPWECHEGIMEPDYVYFGDDEKCDEENRVICEVFSPMGEMHLKNYANLHLIVTAPEMYNSNETTLSELENIVSGLERACDHCDRYLMRGKRACRNCAAEKAKKIAQGMRDRISELQKKARGEQ